MRADYAILAVLLLAISKAGFGGGPGVLATPIMALASTPATSIAVMLPLMVFCDIWCVGLYWKKWAWKSVWPLLLGFSIGLLAATGMLSQLATHQIWLGRIIGGLSILFGLTHFFLKKDKRILPQKAWFGILMGMVGGVASTLAHAAGPITAMYFLSQDEEDNKDRFMGSIVFYSFLGNLLKVPSYLVAGTMNAQTWALTWPLLPVAFVGICLGVYLNRKMSTANFAGWINGLLVVIGIFLIIE